MSIEELRELWRKFDWGKYLSDDELETLRETAEKGAEYLNMRGEKLALSKTYADIAKINTTLAFRKDGW